MQVLVCEMMIYWCDLYKKSLLHFLGIGVLQVRRPEGVRRNALRVLRPNYPHSEEIAQYIEQKTRRFIGHLLAFGGFL